MLIMGNAGTVMVYGGRAVSAQSRPKADVFRPRDLGHDAAMAIAAVDKAYGSLPAGRDTPSRPHAEFIPVQWSG